MNNIATHLEMTKRLLGPLPSRKSLFQTSRFPVSHNYTIRVERTAPFEFIDHLMTPFFGLWEADFITEYSDYDPSLSNLLVHKNIDAYILWMDWRLYKDSKQPKETAEWLKRRIEVIRSQSLKPILVNNWYENSGNGEALFSSEVNGSDWIRELNVCLSHVVQEIYGCEIIDLARLTHEIQGSFYDDRNDQVSQFPFSDQASIAIARHLGVHLFPALFNPRIKALVLDLDDTLYHGVLGEDGVNGIRFSEGHLMLQRLLKRLQQSGILLTLCSRNELIDVKELFQKRKDSLPLQWDDFAAITANWRPKTENIQSISEQLNLNPADFLFIDDSTTELIKAAAYAPAMRLLRAETDAFATLQLLSNYPGLYQLHSDEGASLRTTDIQANDKRNQLKTNAADYLTYLAELQMVVRIFQNHLPHAKRLNELSQKTNQFNLCLKRMNAAEAESVMKSKQFLTFTIQLSDNLSDSGIIGAIVYEIKDKKAYLLELVFSCRALGREVETLAFAYSLHHLLSIDVEHIQILTNKGPRNAPALDWLKRFIKESKSNDLAVNELYETVEAACSTIPAKVEVNV